VRLAGRLSRERRDSAYQNHESIEADIDKTDGVHAPKLLAAGIEFMRANQESPFFLYYASPLPHTKRIPHPDFQGSSEQGTYGDVIQEIDWQVGALLAELEALGLTENTLVIYASDSGPQLNVDGHGSAGVLRDGKGSNFEGGIRVPCLMRWPGKISAEAVNDEIVGIIDLRPTFAELAGVEPPTDRIIDGKSIVSYMLGQPKGPPIHETFVVPGATIRRNDLKLLVSNQKPGGSMKGKSNRHPYSAPAGALFDLGHDAGESLDVSSNHPDEVNQMRDLMADFMQSLKSNIKPRENVETS
jgi:arylsulfatase A-like enzyme